MKPRSLRHRFEKIAKLLVIIHKHTPEVDCRVAEDKGENGHLVVDFSGSGMSRLKMAQLGKDLENKGFAFEEKKSPWLGQITYTGRAEDRPTVVLSLPIVKDRLAITEDSPAQPYSFAKR